MHFTHHLSGLDWGSIPDWVSAIATVLALCGAGVTIWFAARAVRISREANNITLAAYQADLTDRRERQARFVYALNEVPQTHHAGEVIQRFPPHLTGAAETGVFVDGSFRSLNGGKTEQTVAADMLSTTVTVHNRSEEIVASWMVSLYDRSTGAPVGGTGVGDQSAAVLPGETRIVHIDVLAHEGYHPHIGPVVDFRDSSGRLWRRRGSEPIELVADSA